MLNKKITPENALETAVLNKDNAAIVDLIADGAFLTRPDILATKESFDLHYDVAMLLIESAPCLRSESAVKRLEELGAHYETLDLVRETAVPPFENDYSAGAKLIEAIVKGDENTAAKLIIDDDATLYSADLKTFDNLSEFSEEAVVLILDYGVFGRLKAQLFLDLREKAEKRSSKRDVLLFETMKIITKEFDSDERELRICQLWKQHEFSQAIAAEAEKYTDECLADLIIDQTLNFTARPFKAFSPYYQVLLLKSGCVTPEQFGEEAEIEKFDAGAVFELLRYSGKYADRVNWDLVNKSAVACKFLYFLGDHPQYADKADWQMINLQAPCSSWAEFLEKQPSFLEKYQHHNELYCWNPGIWHELILKKAGVSFGNCYAYLYRFDPYEDDTKEIFRVRIKDGKAEFYEINDHGCYQSFSKLAAEDFTGFCKLLEKHEELDGIFVPVIR